MDEGNARRLLRQIDGQIFQPKDELYGTVEHVSWVPGENTVTMEGEFTPGQLEAVAWWMRNKAPGSAA